ncbi:MAG: proline--tRNA ligase [Firmicutes bacterium]|nr:proline--tRNA ligase [Bacillota bacterium]
MKVEKMIGERFKERPSDCAVESHALMVRGGYMKQVANGIYSQMPPLKRISQKIEQIIREEMDALGGQEVSMPVVLPGSLWQESGRYDSVGSELLRFSDRNRSPMVLAMTHEEAAVQLVRDYARTYTRYPFMIYQIQTKFRDEARPRAGMIRVREFTMKDAYSFHTSQEDLERYYARCLRAYERIFARVGLPEVVAVASDSGMMGGSVSHEFMLLTPAGEDTVAVCSECGFRANVEAAECIVRSEPEQEPQPLTAVPTPHSSTIEDLCAFLQIPVEKTCKAVVYQKPDNRYVIAFVRGDLEISESKLTALLHSEIRPAEITEESGIVAGYIGPVGLPEHAVVVLDRSIQNASGLVTGANRPETHFTGFFPQRDCPGAEYYDIAKIKDGGICPHCGKPAISLSRGIEVGNIFQLGTKYSESMGMQYTDENGELKTPVMGCYGIGVGRLAASVCEVRRDAYGPVWPVSIAPWQVELCCLRSDDAAARESADALYRELQSTGVEVLYDDRPVRAGVMFSDADLFGCPVRVVVSPKTAAAGEVELSTRDKSVKTTVPRGQAAAAIQSLLQDLSAAVLQKVPPVLDGE